MKKAKKLLTLSLTVLMLFESIPSYADEIPPETENINIKIDASETEFSLNYSR